MQNFLKRNPSLQKFLGKLLNILDFKWLLEDYSFAKKKIKDTQESFLIGKKPSFFISRLSV